MVQHSLFSAGGAGEEQEVGDDFLNVVMGADSCSFVGKHKHRRIRFGCLKYWGTS